MVESSIVIVGDKIVDCSIGKSCEVEFNWDKVWKAYKQSGKEELPWFIHVHPKGIETYSNTDLDCMQGFHIALGDIIFFSIVIFENDDISDLSYKQIDYTYNEKEDTDYLPKDCTGLLGKLGLAELTILKLASVGVFHTNNKK